MTRSTRFAHLHLTAVTVILALGMLVAASPTAQTYAQGMATPAPVAVTPEVETPVAQSEEFEPPTPAVEETPVPTEAPVEVQQPAGPVSTPAAPEWESIAPASVAPVASNPAVYLSDCGIPQAELVPGAFVSFECTLSKTSGFPVAGVSFTDPGSYFGVGITSNGKAADDIEGHAHKFVMSGISIQLTITITAAANAPMSSIFNAVFEACEPAGNSVNSSCKGTGSYYSVTKPMASLTEDAHYVFSCDQVSPNPAGLGETATSKCTVSPGDQLGDRALRVDQVSWDLNGASGWDVVLDDQKLSAMSGEFVPGAAATISGQASYSFSAKFTPTACTAQSANPRLTLRVNVLETGQSSGGSTSNSQAVSYSFEPAFSGSVHVSQAARLVNVNYSMTSSHSPNTEFKVRYTVTGCQNWGAYATMSVFTHEDNTSLTTVPKLASANSGGTSIISGGNNVTVQPAGFTTLGNAPTRLVTGTAPGKQTLVVEQTIHLRYEVPPNTPVGVYESTITVTTAHAP